MKIHEIRQFIEPIEETLVMPKGDLKRLEKPDRKYEFTGNKIIRYGFVAYQIVVVKDFGPVKKGDIGGWIESEANLSHEGNCWISENIRLVGNTNVSGDVQISGSACILADAHFSSGD